MNTREEARFDAVKRVGRMGEWHTARHVERQKKTKKPDARPAPKP